MSWLLPAWPTGFALEVGIPGCPLLAGSDHVVRHGDTQRAACHMLSALDHMLCHRSLMSCVAWLPFQAFFGLCGHGWLHR